MGPLKESLTKGLLNLRAAPLHIMWGVVFLRHWPDVEETTKKFISYGFAAKKEKK